MDRNALLLYLQNVRDLEVARYVVGTSYQKTRSYYEREINSIQTIPNIKEHPPFIEESGCGFYFWAVFSAICFLLTLVLLSGTVTYGVPPWIWIYIIGGVFSGCVAIKAKPHSRKELWKEYNEEIQKIDNSNREQQEIARRGIEKRDQLSKEWQEKSDWYNKEYAKTTNLLNQFYNMNILASQYRNLASTVYIYDYMSTSQASLNDTLIHEHMENGIQRLEAKIDQVINRLDDLIYETRCANSENKLMVENQISQNEKMLCQLQSIASNSQDAAFYSQLASNYSEANAYFSLANYLKR